MSGPLIEQFETWEREAQGSDGVVYCSAPDGRLLATWRCSKDHVHSLMGVGGTRCSIAVEQSLYFSASIGEGRCPLGHGSLTGKAPKGSGGLCAPCSGWWSTWERDGEPVWEFSFSVFVPAPTTPANWAYKVDPPESCDGR